MTNRQLRRFGLSLSLTAVMVPSLTQAQFTVDVSHVTCTDFLTMRPDQSRVFAGWISGYFSQKKGRTWIDFETHARNVEKVKAWCASHPTEIVIDALEHTAPKQQ